MRPSQGRRMSKVGILGSGSFGTALAVLLATKGHSVVMWSAHPAHLKELEETRVNSKLPGIRLPENVTFSESFEFLKDCDAILLTTASVYVRETATRMKPFVSDGAKIIIAAKGIEDASLKMLYEVVEEVIPTCEAVVLSGPSHAEEVGRLVPTTCVIATAKKDTAEFLQNLFMTDSFRVYTSPDRLGVSIGGACKNVIALAAGVADGLGYGDNTKAALITRGIAEIGRLGLAMGAELTTFAGLSGIGDLIVTCASVHSRNRKCGYLIGQGRTKEEAVKEVGAVVEGIYAAHACLELAKRAGVEMPIVTQVCLTLFEGKNPADAVRDLMMREGKAEAGTLIWKES